MRHHIQTGFLAALAGAALLAAAGTAQADQISVEMDKARTLTLVSPAATVIIGNPLIASAGIQDRQTLIITGKSYGVTNLIVLDTEGRTILSTDLSVTEADTPQTALVSLYRGAERTSYACAGSGSCQHRPMVGDSAATYDTVTGQRDQQISASTGQANGN